MEKRALQYILALYAVVFIVAVVLSADKIDIINEPVVFFSITGFLVVSLAVYFLNIRLTGFQVGSPLSAFR